MNVFSLRRAICQWMALAGLCLPALGQAISLIPADSSWRWLPGTGEPPAEWRNTGFLDGNWNSGAQPFHTDSRPGGTLLPGFGGPFSTLYLRQKFTVSQPTKIGELTLNALVDDGFVAWLNGQEILRHNVPEGALPRTARALEDASEPLSEENFEVHSPSFLLQAGENVLAIQVLNSSSAGVPDLLWNARLEAMVDTVAPVLVAQVPLPDSTVDQLNHLETIFSEAVVGIEAADLLINGSPATNIVQIAPGHYRFEFPPAAAGNVQISFAAGHGINDGLAAPNAFAGATWKVVVNPLANRRNLFINELVADSYRSLKDEDNEYPDWIELANSGNTPIDLLGWALTDEIDKPFKWRFGTNTIAANGYLVVFASQKNKTNITAITKLHTNFKLSNEGEYLALVAPDGEVVSAFSPKFPTQSTDVSWGRVPGSDDLMGYFTKPTPGARNTDSGVGFAPEVVFSRPGAPFANDFELKLTAPGPGIEIRYTVSGAVPTNGSTLYTGPIGVSNTTEIRARAFGPSLLPGPVHTEAYVKLSPDPAHRALFVSTMPILVMSTMRAASISEGRNTAVEFSLHEPVDGLASLFVPPTFTSRGAAKVRGSSTASIAKSSYAIEWWDEFNEDKNRGILGMPADSEWVLYAPNIYDLAKIHNPFIHQLSRDMGEYSPRTRFVELYVNRTAGPLLTNQWMGIYVLEEKPAIDGGRLDIGKLQSEDTVAPNVTGGYLMKIDRLDPGDGGLNAGGATIAWVDPKEPEVELPQRRPQYNYISTYINNFAKALNNGSNWRDPVLGYLPYIDVTNWVDYHILETLSGNVDALVLSAYFHKPRNEPLKWGTHWDFDRALGSTDGRDANPRNWNTGPFFSSVWWNRVLRDPTAWQLWVDRYQAFRQNHLSRSNMNRLMDRFAGEVAPSTKREERRWSELRPRGGSYQAEINLMKNWVSNRVDFFDKQMTAMPVLSAAGGPVTPGFQLTITRASGTVYYTLDGTDPRLAYGTNQPAPGALIYSGPITINANSRVVARAYDTTKRQTSGPLTSTPWSGPVAATFTVTEPALTVTEIMFHPAKPVPDGLDEDEYEFIELKNISNQAVSLPGYRLSGGVDFTFSATNEITQLAAGQRLLLVGNRAAFESRYPGIGGIAGEYSGRLGNAGARLHLRGPLQEPIFDFDFEDRWSLLADGSGFSLVRIGDGGATSGDPALATSWRTSGRFGGSPGQPDPEPTLPASIHSAIRIGEIFTGGGSQNFIEIELLPGQATPIDLSGWWLSDERDDWRKFRLPAGSVLNPTTTPRLIIRESKFDLPGGEGFKLDPAGGEVWLFSADAGGELTGFVTGGDYGNADMGQSWIADGLSLTEQSFVLAANASAGLPNPAPVVGPVVFRTIHFNPPPLGTESNSRDEFVELENTTAAPVPLFVNGLPNVTWHLRGGAEMEFPPGLTLAPHARLLLVGFAPESDPASLHAFLARHSPDPEMTILGPWSGQLSNEGESLRLKRPASGTTAATTNVIYIDVDVASYLPTAPWPTNTTATGRALVRTHLNGIGSDPANWIGMWPTPGLDDSDFDGLPDDWETAHGLDPAVATGDNGGDGDPDADGFTNRMEFINGSNPKLAGDGLRPRVTVGTRGNLVFHLNAPAGRTISLQRSDVPAGGTWLTVKTLTTSSSAAALAFEEVDSNGRFYRLSSD